MHPEREIRVWQHMLHCYQHFISQRALAQEQKMGIFKVILGTVNCGPEHVVQTVKPLTLSRKRVREIAAYVATSWRQEDR